MEGEDVLVLLQDPFITTLDLEALNNEHLQKSKQIERVIDGNMGSRWW